MTKGHARREGKILTPWPSPEPYKILIFEDQVNFLCKGIV